MTQSDPTPASENNPPSPPSQTPPPAKPSDKPRKKRRRWPWVVGGTVLVLLIIVGVLAVILPTLLSSGWGRSLVVKQINNRINGHIEIKDWTIAWNSGLSVDGLVLQDASGRQILQLPHFSSGLTVMDLARGRYELGKTEVDGLDVLVSREADGSLNWQHLAKSTPAKEPAPARPKPAAPRQAGPTHVPDVSGQIVLKDCNITYEDRTGQQPPVFLRSVQADVNIPNINQPITDSLSAQVQIASDKPGTISSHGTIAVVQKNTVALDTASLDQTLDIGGIDLAAVSTLLGPDLKLTGRTDGRFAVQLSNGTQGIVEASMQSTGFGAAGPKLQGATLTSNALTFQLPRSTLHVPQGIGNPKSADLQLGDKQSPISLQLKNATIARAGAAAPVLGNDTFSVLSAAHVASTPQGRDLKLGRLEIEDSSKIVSLVMAGDHDVAVSLPATGSPTAGGKVHVFADLKRLDDIAQAFQGPQVVARDENGNELRSGILEGDLALAQADAQRIGLNGDLAVRQLTIGSRTASPLENETVQITLRALANHDLSDVQVPMLSATGNLLNASVSDASLKLSNGPQAPPVPVLQILRSATVKATIPSLERVQQVLRAFSPPAAGSAKAPAAASQEHPPAGEAAAASSPPPPADITGGSLELTLEARSSEQTLSLTPHVAFKGLSFRRGTVSYDAGDVALDTQADVIQASTAAPAGSMMDQIAEIRVPQLHLTAPKVGGAELSLVDPLDVKSPGNLANLLSPPAGAPGGAVSPASVTGHILARGNPGPLLALMNTLSGQPATHHLDGSYAFDEKLATDASGAILASGRADLNDLVMDGTTIPEKAFRVFNDVALNSSAKTLDLRNVMVDASATNALKMTVKGRIIDLGGKQQIENVLGLDLDYDAAKLWKVILPLMSKDTQEKLKDAQVAGAYHKRFEVSGAYPSGATFQNAIQQLAMSGGIQLDLFDGEGVILKQVDIPLDLKKGVLTIAYADKPAGQNFPPAASFNNGTLNLGGSEVDLRGEHLRLTTPKGMKLVENATLNPVFAAWSLGSILNNPLFVGAKQATGLLTVVVENCQRLPLDSALTSQNDGTAAIDISIKGLHLGNDLIQKVSELARINMSSLQGDVQTYHVTINNGIVSQNLVLAFGENKRPLKLYGDVRMSDKQMLPVTIDLPWKLLGLSGMDKNVQKFLPEGIEIPLRGSVSNPQLAFDFNKMFQDAAQKGLLQGLLGKKQNAQDNTTQPAEQNPFEELQKLLN